MVGTVISTLWVRFRNNLGSWLFLPTPKELLIIGVFLFVQMILHAFYLNGDAFYGYAIAEKIVHPSWYAANDLVINSSYNFLFYKVMALFPFFKDNFVLRDFVVSFPLTILYIWAWVSVFYYLSKSRLISLLSLFFLLFADDKLSLGGTALPFFILTSLGSVQWLQILALLFFLRNKNIIAFTILALTAYFHPASAFMFLLSLGGWLALEAWRQRNFKIFVYPIAVAAAILSPNLWMLNSNLGTSVDTEKYFRYFYLLQGGHSYLADYFNQSYLYVISIFLLFIIVTRRNKLFDLQNKILEIVIFVMLSVGAWLVNLYFIKNLSVFYLYFAMRSTYLIKPLFIFFVILVFYDCWSGKSVFAKLTSLLLLISLVLFPSNYAFLFSIILMPYYFFQGKLGDKINKFFGSGCFLGVHRLFASRYFFTVALTIAMSVAVAMFGFKYNNKFYKLYRFVRGDNIFNFSFDVSKNYLYHKYDPDFSGLLDWAKKFSGKMFITPFNEGNFSTPFRYLTHNSIYINQSDLGQVSYAPSLYFIGINRANEVGVNIIGRGIYDDYIYQTAPLEYFKKTGADFIVFNKEQADYTPRSQKPVFENRRYIIFSLK